MADGVALHSLPVFLRLAGRPVMLIGEGVTADAKRRLLERAGATVVGEDATAALAIVALDDPDETVARLRARGMLVNAADRPDLCDFTLPAIIDRSPVIVAIGTGGTSAGLAAALRQRLEASLPTSLGGLADALFAARARFRTLLPDADTRRRALAQALGDGGALDVLVADAAAVQAWQGEAPRTGTIETIRLTSPDPDTLTLYEARLLARADRVCHAPGVPAAILDRARADAPRIVAERSPVDMTEGLTVYLEMAR